MGRSIEGDSIMNDQKGRPRGTRVCPGWHSYRSVYDTRRHRTGTIPDVLYHLGMVGLLSWGLIYTHRRRTALGKNAERPKSRRAA